MIMRSTSLGGRSVSFTLLAILMLAGGCVRTAHPILNDNQVITNDALLGKWVSVDGKTSAELTHGDGSHYKFTYTGDDGKTSHFLVRLGKIGEVTVAELSPEALVTAPNDSLLIPLYSFFVIEKTTPNSVVVSGMSFDWFDKFIKANPDELDVIKVADQDDIVNSSTEDFQAFFTRHLKDNGMLGKSATFIHPGDPTTQPAK